MTPGANVPGPTSPMYTLGAVILAAVLLWFGFQAADSTGLGPRQASAVVVNKTHRDAARTYTTTIINKQTHVIPQVTAEAYVLDLDLSGKRAEGTVERALYEAVRVGDRVNVTYRKRRLTGKLEVVAVSR